DHRDLHSFPTRRSSDLDGEGIVGALGEVAVHGEVIVHGRVGGGDIAGLVYADALKAARLRPAGPCHGGSTEGLGERGIPVVSSGPGGGGVLGILGVPLGGRLGGRGSGGGGGLGICRFRIGRRRRRRFG